MPCYALNPHGMMLTHINNGLTLPRARWLLFLVFAGVGVLAAPIDWIQQWRSRPTSVITRSEYMRRARIIAQRSKEVLVRWGGAGVWIGFALSKGFALSRGRVLLSSGLREGGE